MFLIVSIVVLGYPTLRLECDVKILLAKKMRESSLVTPKCRMHNALVQPIGNGTNRDFNSPFQPRSCRIGHICLWSDAEVWKEAAHPGVLLHEMNVWMLAANGYQGNQFGG